MVAEPIRIIRVVARKFGLAPSDLTGRSRDSARVLARHIAMYLICQETPLTLAQTGAELGGRVPATICYAYVKIATGIEKDVELRKKVAGIRKTLRTKEVTTMGKVTLIIASDRLEEDEIREKVQGWIDGAYDLDPAEYKIEIKLHRIESYVT